MLRETNVIRESSYKIMSFLVLICKGIQVHDCYNCFWKRDNAKIGGYQQFTEIH